MIYRSIIPNSLYYLKTKSNVMNNKNMVLIVSLITIVISANLSTTVKAELNTNDFEFSIHITDVIPFYTWNGISNLLTDNERSFEDVDTIRLIIQDTNYYAVYNNNVSANTFEFVGIYQNGA